MRTALTLFGLLLIGGAPSPATADEPKAAPSAANREADEKAIREADAAFVRAYNAGDVKAIAALFTEDAQALDENGDVIKGRDHIATLFETLFGENAGAKIEVAVDSIHFPTPDVALETGRTKLTAADGGAPDRRRYTVLFVKRDGKWLQSHVQEHPDKQVDPHERLEELAWMVGDWVDESSAGVANTSCRWSADKNYLLRDYTVHVAGKRVMSGTQRIGWDPLNKQIKSWIFDSDGGHAEGLWSRNGNQWVVKIAGVMPDGRRITSTQLITFKSKDMGSWAAMDRTMGDTLLPDVEEVRMVKKPPQPK